MTRKTKTGNTETAVTAYAERATRIDAQIATLVDMLKVHRAQHDARPADWGLVGDLGHVKELLGNVIEFLGDGR